MYIVPPIPGTAGDGAPVKSFNHRRSCIGVSGKRE
jgi:hypothetical protein